MNMDKLLEVWIFLKKFFKVEFFLFKGIYRACNSGERGTLYWTGNWVTFLDSLLQTALLAERADTLRLPTRVRYLRIDPVRHLECIEEKGFLI